jgi:hypothetical protein
MTRFNRKTLTTMLAVGFVLAATIAAAAPVAPVTPTLRITSFRDAVDPGTVAGTTVGGGAPAAPTHSTIEFGESEALSWSVHACHMQTITVAFDGVDVPIGTRHNTSDGCFWHSGQRTVQPQRTTSFRLRAAGTPVGGAAMAPAPVERSFEVRVRKPDLDILEPVFNQGAMTVALSARNKGDGKFLSNRINVTWSVARAPGHHSPAGEPFANGTFNVGPLEVAAGQRFDLGSITIPDRARAFAQDTVQLAVRLNPTYPLALGETRESFNHRWETQTFTINSGVVRLISLGSSYNFRLNNYRSGGHHVANDCSIALDVFGHPASMTFNIDRFTHDVLIAVPPNPIPITDEAAIFVNNLNASRRGPDDLFFVRDGKLGVHLEFDNPANDEIKTGMLFGPRDEWRDGMIADVNLSAFTLDVLLTPELRDGKVSYGRVEVIATGVDASAVGALDGLINTFFGDYLRRYVRDTIVTYLTQVLQTNTVRNAVADSLTSAVGSATAVTRILTVRGAGNTITITYL